MQSPVVYFAYGSNLHLTQMRSRCPESALLQPALLEGYRLAFRGHSRRWGGGAATILPAPGDTVPGLLYLLSAADLALLNGFEGHPHVYGHLPVQVLARDGARLEALTYQRLDGTPNAPSLRYFHQIWRSSKAFALDEAPLLAALEEALAHGPPPAPGHDGSDGA
jgi:Gamma-glutamyl cyclotransferase, AIG2-like